MNWTIVIMVVSACIVMPLIIAIASYKEKKLKLERELALTNAGNDRQDTVELRAEVDRLRARVAVLERIATSEDRRVADEIERLSRPGAGASL